MIKSLQNYAIFLLAVSYFIFTKNSILEKGHGPKCVSEYIHPNIIKKTFHVKAVFVSNLTRNTMRYNNHDDLLQFSFTLKISLFSKVYI